MKRLSALFGSLGLSCVLLVLLGVLTWLGTLAQVETGLYEVQQRYFESWFVVHRAGPVPVPLPGARLVLSLLAVNLVVGGMLRLRRDRAVLGVLVTHVGIAMLLVAAFVKSGFSDDGHVTLFEGQSSSSFQSYHRWEIAIASDAGEGRVRELLVPQEDFADARNERPVTLRSKVLPFDLVVHRFDPNARPVAGETHEGAVVVDGMALEAIARAPQNERNAAGAVVELALHDGTRQRGLLWGIDLAPWVVEVGGRTWSIDLRRERYPMPFTLALEDFRMEEHPGIAMPRSFESDVSVEQGSATRPATISMNEPLREGGLVLYQASWGPQGARPGDRLFSTLAVVRNPVDMLPLWACVVIAVGLTLHFGRALVRYVRVETRRA